MSLLKGVYPLAAKQKCPPDRTEAHSSLNIIMITFEQVEVVRALNWGHLSAWGQECLHVSLQAASSSLFMRGERLVQVSAFVGQTEGEDTN